MSDKIKKPDNNQETVQSNFDQLIEETRCNIEHQDLSEDEQNSEYEIYSGLDLIMALAQYAGRAGENASAHTFNAVSEAVVAATMNDVAWYCPPEPPDKDDLDDRFRWLNAVEILALAAQEALALSANCTWSAKLHQDLKTAVEVRTNAIKTGRAWWKFGASAEHSHAKHGKALAPWSNILSCDMTKEIAADAPLQLVKEAVAAWIRYDLSQYDSETVKNLVSTNAVWQEVYHGELERVHDIASITGVVAVPASLRSVPVKAISLPHLGKETYLKTHLTDNGLLLECPGRSSISLVWGQNGLIDFNIGDETTGELPLRFKRIDAELYTVSFAAVTALAEIERNPDFSEDRALKVARTTIELLLKEDGWSGRLARIAEDFESGETVEADEVIFVDRAIEARAALDVLIHRYLDVELSQLISMLDERLSGIKEAVLAVPEERYYNIIEFAEPEPGSWWASRLDLDLEIPEDVLFEALNPVRDNAEQMESAKDND